MQLSRRKGISTPIIAIVIVVVLVIAAVAAYELSRSNATSTTSSSSTSSTSSSSTTSITSPTTTTSVNTATGTGPTTLTWDTGFAPSVMDTNLGGAGGALDIVISENTNEQLLWYNGSCGTCVVPWLAQNYSVSSNGLVYSFTLRQGIKFQDGEPFNSSAVYFSFNRMLVDDSSAFFGHGVGFSFEIQQFLNNAYDGALCGCSETYNDTFVNHVLAENFVQVTGTYTFNLNFQVPFTGVPYLLASANFADIVAPGFVMTHDIPFWSLASNNYTLPYKLPLSGNATTQYHEYYDDLMATCNAGVTPSGCGQSYQDVSPIAGSPGYNGPVESGTGPYVDAGWDHTTNVVTLTANNNYWGGGWVSKIKPYFQTIDIKQTTQDTTRALDLTTAAKSGAALVTDTDLAQVQNIINRNAWLDNHTMISVIPGVTVNGPNPISEVNFFSIADNNTNPFTGKYLTFQPWSDVRFRQAIGDSVNISAINQADNLGLALQVDSPVSPAYSPTGAYNTSTTPGYSYNPDMAAQLLLSMMKSPTTTFHFYNGTLAKPGFFNNTFGCTALGANNQCSNPVTQTVLLQADPTRAYDTAIATAIVESMNNISAAYNLGLTFNVQSLSTSQIGAYQYGVIGSIPFCWDGGWPMFYPYVLDALTGTASQSAAGYPYIDRDNVSALNTLYNEAFTAATTGNSTGFIHLTWKIEQYLNNQAYYIIEGEPEYITATTSNIHGYFFNPSLITDEFGSGTMYFAAWYSTA
ncbi:MAG: ABC transporter substrate-binding protein [Thaumarchaeota archaeon]|nr:ABC transporter substrate-binding protein [Nitrososphaerota archaeon]